MPLERNYLSNYQQFNQAFWHNSFFLLTHVDSNLLRTSPALGDKADYSIVNESDCLCHCRDTKKIYKEKDRESERERERRREREREVEVVEGGVM